MHAIPKIAVLIAALLASASPAAGQTAVPAPSSEQRLEQLEKALEQLQQQNQELQKEVEALRQDRRNPIASQQNAETAKTPDTQPTASTPSWVMPWGKESKLKLGGFLQANAEMGDVGAFEGSFATKGNDRIRLRRARINVSGDFLEKFDFKFEGDFQQGDGIGGRTAFSATDVFANWHQFPEANIKLGQFKAPFGLEQITSDTRILTAERSLPTGALTPEREVGIQLWGNPLTHVVESRPDLLTYAVGIFNGAGRNTVKNDNNQFMYAGRIQVMPFSGMVAGHKTKWQIGLDGLYSRNAAGTDLTPVGNLLFAPAGDGSLVHWVAPAAAEQQSWGVDQTLSFGPFDLTAEYLEEHIRPIGGGSFADTTANGYYVEGAYMFPGDQFQLAAKWESLNPGQRPDDNIQSITGGINYYIKGDDLKLMLDYVHTWSDFRHAHPALGPDEFDLAILRFQLMF